MSPDGRNSGQSNTRVLVAAESALVRAGLQAVIGRVGPGLTLAGAPVPLGAVVRAAAERQPDVVLLALEDEEEQLALISALSGRAASQRPALAGEPGFAGPVVVVLAEMVLVRESLQRGARAVLAPDSSAEEIVAAVVAASSGLVALLPDAIESLVGTGRDLPSHSGQPGSWDGPAAETLTPREVEVLAMLAEGLGNKEIAARLRISEHTVKFHVGSILGKLGAASRTEAVSRGIRRGLIIL